MELGLLMGEERTAPEEIQLAARAEEAGVRRIWFGEHVLIKDSLVMTALALSATRRAVVGPCAVNPWTRNAAVLMASISTLYSVYPGRLELSIAPGEEVLVNYGVSMKGSLRAMEETITALRRLMRLEVVDMDGEHVKMKRALVTGFRDEIRVPVYLAAMGLRMLRLAGAVADGAVINFLAPESYIREAIDSIREGLASSRRSEFRIFQLIAASSEEDRDGLRRARRFLAKFYRLSPDFYRKYMGDEWVIDEVIRRVELPFSEEQLDRAAEVIPEEHVRRLMAFGSPEEVLTQVEHQTEKWGSIPVLYVLDRDPVSLLKHVAEGLSRG